MSGVDYQERGFTILQAIANRLRTEQGVERHRHGPSLDRPEETCVEPGRRLHHHRDAVSRFDAEALQQVRELRCRMTQFAEGQFLSHPASVRDSSGDMVRRMAIEALVGDVQVLTSAIEQIPELIPAEVRDRPLVTVRADHRAHYWLWLRLGSSTVALPRADSSPSWLSASSSISTVRLATSTARTVPPQVTSSPIRLCRRT